VQYVGKGEGKAKGKGGFQGQCWVCGEFGHSSRFCPKGKGKASDKGMGKGYGKDNFKGGLQFKGFGKGYGWYGKGKGDFGKGGGTAQRACFGCGSTEHLLKDCPKAPNKVNQVTEEPDEILFIGNIREE
jgi:cellular nucleic acid-binding protein